MTTYYVDPASGNDANAGTSFAAAWATTQKAADTAVAGDLVRLCDTATETTAVQIDFDTNSGTATSIIEFESWNSTGTARKPGYTIQASALMTSVVNFGGTVDFVRLRGVTIDANSNANYALGNSVDTCSDIYCRQCSFTGGTTAGVGIRGTATPGWFFLDCNSYANLVGLSHAFANRGAFVWRGGSIHDNTLHGWEINRTACLICQCQIYDNGGDGINSNSNSGLTAVVNCTIYGNSGDGIKLSLFSGRDWNELTGTTMTGNGGYGLNAQTFGNIKRSSYNHHYNNTSGSSDVPSLLGDEVVTGDPLFTSVTNGSEDFAPQDGSPLDGTGISGSDIGAVGSVDPVGGGGGTVGFAL